MVPAPKQPIDLWHLHIIGTSGWRVDNTQSVLVTSVTQIDDTVIEIHAKSSGGRRFICRRPVTVPVGRHFNLSDYLWHLETEKFASSHVFIESVVAYNIHHRLCSHAVEYKNHRIFQNMHGGIMQNMRPIGHQVRYDSRTDLYNYVHEFRKPSASRCSEPA